MAQEGFNPFLLHPSDQPGLILVSQPLTETNYNSWSRSMKMALNSKRKIGFIDGSIPRPDPDQDPALLELWQCNNDIVSTWILNCMSKDIAESVIYADSAASLWNDLQERFLQTNGPRLFELRKSMYKKAIRKALLDRVPDEKASEVTTVLIIVGAGRGPLVWTSLKAAEEVGREIKIYALDKNINRTVSLNALICSNRWSNKVTIVTTDVRYWNAPEMADIMVSELLGSFGDNELSNELLDGAQRFLKEDGISIPSSYTSLLQPLTASKLYNDVRSREDILNAETACVVKMHRVARLAPCQPVFTFTHPKRHKESNQRHKKLHFVIPNDTGSAMVHGFAGYFDATLYKDVRLGNEPSTTNLCSWFPMFFPLRRPVCVRRGSALDLHFWRCYDLRKVWYEWCVTSPSLTPIHNCNGRSYWVSL